MRKYQKISNWKYEILLFYILIVSVNSCAPVKYPNTGVQNAAEPVNTEEKTEPVSICGNDFCEQNESHILCPADCFPEDTEPTDPADGYKAVYLDFVYKGQKSGIYFVVNKDVHEELASLPRTLSYFARKKVEVSKKDFILPKLNNQLQARNLLPLVEQIKALTPDIHKQARIAVSLVQHIPYGLTDPGEAEADHVDRYPYGVIWSHMGVCSEKSDLLLFILRELGFGTATLVFKKENHRAVGIKCPDAYDIDDSGYCFVETSGPGIITDSLSSYSNVGTLTDFTVINISDGIELEGVEEEFEDKKKYYDLLEKAKINNGVLKDKIEYNLYISIVSKYDLK